MDLRSTGLLPDRHGCLDERRQPGPGDAAAEPTGGARLWPPMCTTRGDSGPWRMRSLPGRSSRCRPIRQPAGGPPSTSWRTRPGGSTREAADKEGLEERLWMLSDPLYLVEGNDRKTEQYARQVLIRIRGGGRQRYGSGLGRRPGGDHPPLGSTRGLVPGARPADGGHAGGLPAYGEPPPRSGVPAPG